MADILQITPLVSRHLSLQDLGSTGSTPRFQSTLLGLQDWPQAPMRFMSIIRTTTISSSSSSTPLQCPAHLVVIRMHQLTMAEMLGTHQALQWQCISTSTVDQ